MALYNEQFSFDLNFPAKAKPEKTLVISSTPRCGSHMLGHSLYDAKRFGFPLEYFQHNNLVEWKRILKTESLSDTINELQKIRTSPNGVFSTKMHYTHIKQFENFQNFLNNLVSPYFVLLTRRNALKQAISYSIAAQTGVWIDGQQGNGIPPQYNFEQINNKLNIVLKQNAAWRYLLLTHNCRFIEVDFDHAKENIQNTIKAIANFMDIQLDEKDICLNEPSTNQQYNTINSEWNDRFITDYDGRELDILNHNKSRYYPKSIFYKILSTLKQK